MSMNQDLLRGVATVIGGGFIVYVLSPGARNVLRLGPADQSIDFLSQPVAFWLSVVSMTLLGLFILGVGHRWEIVRRLFELAGQSF